MHLEWKQGSRLSLLVAAFGIAVATLMWTCNQDAGPLDPMQLEPGVRLVDARGRRAQRMSVEQSRLAHDMFLSRQHDVSAR